jgi:hypothetical protein
MFITKTKVSGRLWSVCIPKNICRFREQTENVELIVNDADGIRQKILEKFTAGRENLESATI